MFVQNSRSSSFNFHGVVNVHIQTICHWNFSDEIIIKVYYYIGWFREKKKLEITTTTTNSNTFLFLKMKIAEVRQCGFPVLTTHLLYEIFCCLINFSFFLSFRFVFLGIYSAVSNYNEFCKFKKSMAVYIHTTTLCFRYGVLCCVCLFLFWSLFLTITIKFRILHNWPLSDCIAK